MYTTEGIILKRTDVGEADSLFTIYTKDFGKIRALAQGIKKEGAKLRGHLEPLNLSSISFVLGKNGERLTHATLFNYWPNIRTDLAKLKLASRVIETVDDQCLWGDKDEKLWHLVSSSFAAIEEKDPASSEGFWENFQKELALVLGYAGVSDLPDFGYNRKYD